MDTEKKRVKPSKKDLKHELNRYQTAKENIINKMNHMTVNNSIDKDILEVQKALINDGIIEKEIINRISQQDICALDSVSEVYDKYISILNNADDDYMKQRVLDFIDIKNQIINQLFEDKNEEALDCNAILITKQIFPSQVLNLDSYIKGVISFEGSSVTHSAILLREKNLPYVVVESLNVKHGDYIILDAIDGRIIINPDEKTIQVYALKANELSYKEVKVFNHEGYHVGLNISNDINQSHLTDDNVAGISLFRTEFLYLSKNAFPSFEEQVEVYLSLLRKSHPKFVVIRTYDIGEDKSLDEWPLNTKGLDNYFNIYNKEVMVQLKALLTAYQTHDNLMILLPMVKTNKEVFEIKKMIEEANLMVGLSNLPKLGIMIETKEAYENLESFKDVDFISIGSNDLGQSLFNVDREDIQDFRKYTEKLIAPIEKIMTFASKHQIDCTVCGGLSANEYSIKRLLDIGVKSFGVPISFVVEAHLAIQRHINGHTKKI